MLPSSTFDEQSLFNANNEREKTSDHQSSQMTKLDTRSDSSESSQPIGLNPNEEKEASDVDSEDDENNIISVGSQDINQPYSQREERRI